MHSGWYSVTDEAFYTKTQIQTHPDGTITALETGSPVEWTSEDNYCFRLSKFRTQLLGYYRQYPTAIVPRKYHTEVVAGLERGLEDISISRPRTRLSWGVEVPGDPDQTIYVWFDALINYLTVTGFPWAEKDSSAPASVSEETEVPSEVEDVIANLEESGSLTTEMNLPEVESAVEESKELESITSDIDNLEPDSAAIGESESNARTEYSHLKRQPKEKPTVWPPDVHFIGKDIIRY